ncbi:hypothetical protein Tsubulata_020098 [Turnera subulata]|uniref:KIB1-4 beta-propeller domain-containing protein n=1 Tax=Turnera subulata TaxID=218843 RepID=A0A9Q0GIX8_9ROSI|nr:hypothetical protein Tsubulata_020098 [Turnera subulata]
MDSSGTRQWCDLVTDLLSKIAGCLENQCDLRRFRSVCRSWRTSTPRPPLPAHPLEPYRFLKLPSFPAERHYGDDTLVLVMFTVYSIEPLHQHQEDNTTAIATRPWVVKLKFWCRDTVRLSELSDSNLIVEGIHTLDLPKVLDLRDYQVREICSAYYHEREFICDTSRVRSGSFCKTEDGFILLMVARFKNELCMWRVGDDDWTLVDVTVEGFHGWYETVGCHNGKFYVVGDYGLTVTVDPISLEIKQVASNAESLREDRLHRFVLGWSEEDLFLVDMLSPDDLDIDGDKLSYEFRVWKLDEKRLKWVEEEEGLKDHVLFIANDWSALVPAKLLPGYKRNCAYFADGFGCCDHPASNFLVCELGRGPKEAVHLCSGSSSNFFWPPPSWLNQNQTLPNLCSLEEMCLFC